MPVPPNNVIVAGASGASVATRGIDSGPFFSHQSRYSAVNQQLQLTVAGALQMSSCGSEWGTGGGADVSPPPKGAGGTTDGLPGPAPASGYGGANSREGSAWPGVHPLPGASAETAKDEERLERVAPPVGREGGDWARVNPACTRRTRPKPQD